MYTPKITVNIIRHEQLSPSKKEEMWNVYNKYYSYTKESFMARMSKNNYFSLYQVAGEIVGFTGLRIQEFMFDGKKRFMMYFGQTVIDQAYRGKSFIPITGVKLVAKYFHKLLYCKAYFWCDCLSYKPYLIVAKSLDEYYPSHKEETPESVKSLMDYLGTMNYGDNYLSKSGTIRKDKKLVVDPSVQIKTQDLQDPAIRFYAQANKKLNEGHGLLTFAPANFRNLLRLMKRMIRLSMAKKKKKSYQIKPVLA